MAYSPPAGDSLNFQFTGASYSAPAGDAVNFNFQQTFTGSVSTTLHLQALVFGGKPVSGAGAYKLNLTPSAQGSAPISGFVSNNLHLIGTASGVSKIYGVSAGLTNIRGNAAGVAAVFGTSFKQLSLTGAASGAFAIIGGLNKSSLVKVTLTGVVPPIARASSKLGLRATGGALVGQVGAAAATLRPMAHASCGRGNSAVVGGVLEIHPQVNCFTGASGSVQTTSLLTASAFGEYLCPTTGYGAGVLEITPCVYGRHDNHSYFENNEQAFVSTKQPGMAILQ